MKPPTPRFLLYFSQRYSIPIGRPLQTELRRRGFEMAWFCDEEESKAFLSDDDLLLERVEEVLAFNPQVVLCSTNIVPDFFPGIKVQIFHGFSVGKRSSAKGHFNIRGFFDLYCTQGPSTTQPFQELQRTHRHFEVIETGWSKVDPLFEPQTPHRRTTPVVMISSTFTPRLSLAHNEAALNEIARLSRTGAWEFIAVLHPKMEPAVVKRVKALENEHFTFYDTTELIALYRRADIMLADTTSAIVEFMLQGKPVVTLNNNRPDAYLLNITTPTQLENALQSALHPSPELTDAIDQFIAQTHPYRDSQSSRRIVEASLHVLKTRHLKRKPLNLLRRCAIRQRLHYFPCLERIKEWWHSFTCKLG